MKISGKMLILTDTLEKMSQNSFAYFSISEHSASFTHFQKKHPQVFDAFPYVISNSFEIQVHKKEKRQKINTFY